MPYHSDGSKIKNPSRKQTQRYEANKMRKSTGRKNASGGKTGGAAIGGGGAA